MSEKFHFVQIRVYLGFEFVSIRLTLDLNSALGSTERGQDLFREYWDY